MESLKFFVWVAIFWTFLGCELKSSKDKPNQWIASITDSSINKELRNYINENDTALKSVGRENVFYILLFKKLEGDSTLEIQGDIFPPVYLDSAIRFKGGCLGDHKQILFYSNDEFWTHFVNTDSLKTDINFFVTDKLKNRMIEAEIFPIWSYKLDHGQIININKTLRIRFSDSGK